MTLLDWIERGYSRSEARDLMIEHADPRHWEEAPSQYSID
jgi:hypothetical protein